MAFDPASYGPVFEPLIAEKRNNPLDPGMQNTDAEAQLKSLNLEQAFADKTVADSDMANACLCAVWLHHNFLDESHTISQGIDTATGSYWHGIMHRREPDFSNSKYWFQKVGQHPAFEALQEAVRETVGDPDKEAAFLTEAPWDASAFVDLCEACHTGKSGLTDLCVQVQQIEWEVLFDFSYRKALGE